MTSLQFYDDFLKFLLLKIKPHLHQVGHSCNQTVYLAV